MTPATAAVLLLATLCLLVAHLLRASRSALLFRPGSLRGRFNILLALSLGYLVNAVVPLRLGELVLAWVVSRRDRVSFGESAANVAAERLSDLFVVALIAGWLMPRAGALFGTLAAAGFAFAIGVA